MESYKLFLNEANKSYRIADHLAYVTYPIIKDNKLIIIITENLYRALLKGMDALLYYDVYYKRINNIPENFDLKLDIFRRVTAKRYNVEKYSFLLKDLKQIIANRKKSKMEFVRKDKYVLFFDNFVIKSITINDVKNYINNTKLFIEDVNKILN